MQSSLCKRSLMKFKKNCDYNLKYLIKKVYIEYIEFIWIWNHKNMHLPWMFAEYIEIYWFYFSQTLITSIISSIFFIVFIWFYNSRKKKNPDNFFVSLMDLILETIDDFFGSVSDKIPSAAKTYILFLFVYILWNNLFGLFVDMFSVVVPFLHTHLRPVNTDIYFNAVLALFWVLWSIVYGIQNNGLKFFERYIPLKWVWIVKMDKLRKLPIKIIDILLWLFIGFLEFIWEITKVMSLTLRLFWNIFAWVMLITLITAATIYLIKVPLIAPLIVLLLELLVSVLQAFVFSLLVLIYFKMAEESH